jgi:hypothetical protein
MTSFIGNAPNQVPTNGDLGTAAFVEAASLATLTDTQTLTNKTISGVDNTLTNVSLTTAVTGTLPAANGGTGLATLTTNNLLAGNGTGAVNLIAPGTNGNILQSNGTAWSSQAPPSIVLGGFTALQFNTTYTATEPGFFFGTVDNAGAVNRGVDAVVDGTIRMRALTVSTGASGRVNVFCPVNTGSTYRLNIINNASAVSAFFVPISL